jgi:hypothetical protein
MLNTVCTVHSHVGRPFWQQELPSHSSPRCPQSYLTCTQGPPCTIQSWTDDRSMVEPRGESSWSRALDCGGWMVSCETTFEHSSNQSLVSTMADSVPAGGLPLCGCSSVLCTGVQALVSGHCVANMQRRKLPSFSRLLPETNDTSFHGALQVDLAARRETGTGCSRERRGLH